MGTEVFLGMPPPGVVAWIKAERDRKGPLFFEANEAGASVAMLCYDEYNYLPTDLKSHLQYSTDKMVTWETYDGSIVELDDCTDNRVYFRADPENPNTDGFHKDDYDHEEAWTHYFKTDGSVKAGGNIQFLLESTGTREDVPEWGFYCLFGFQTYDESGEQTSSCQSLTTTPALPATMLANSCYVAMFQNCSSLTTAPVLPATTLVSNCYIAMFFGCTSLTSAPVLPAETLAEGCYQNMFSHCSSLTTAPALPAEALAEGCYFYMFSVCSSLTTAPATLPATTLANYCYSSMFTGCTSLTTAPTLPATTLVPGCYNNMFHGCSNLASIDVNFTAWNPTDDATTDWVSSVAASGTFTCPSALPKTTGISNIPSGWTIIEK